MLNRLLILPIRFYQLCISPFLPNVCGFSPSCSQYAVDAIGKYGIIRGLFMAFRRILRCHPVKCLGGGSGHDPVK